MPAFRPASTDPNLLWLRGPTSRNLAGDDIPFAKAALNVITGVSGAGKSTLLTDTLAPAINRSLGRRAGEVGAYRNLEDHEELTDVITLEARPIGRTPRSNPATYTGLFDIVRKAFAATPAARERGFSASRFSFNTAGGRCSACEGAGITRVPMHGLGDVSVICSRCEGRRFDPETLAVKLFGLDVAQVLQLEVREARGVLETLGGATRILEALEEVGLGYLTLGQPATALSGGEAQRVRLATELAKPVRGPSLYALDEPSKGLHPKDLGALLRALHSLVERGHTVVAVEHDPQVWRAADWVVDLGPGAGSRGGNLLYAGPPNGLVDHPRSPTAAVLRGELVSNDDIASSEPSSAIELEGVRTHNLRGVDVAFPHRALTVICGPSGSGKTSLAFDSLAAEAQLRLAGRLGAHVRQRIRQLPRPELDMARGLTPTVALRQRLAPPQPRSTVGTMTETQDLLRLMFSRLGSSRDRLASAFSFNHEAGACPSCTGLGFRLAGDPDRLVTHPERPILEGACDGTTIGKRFTDPVGQYAATLRAAADRAGVALNRAFEALPEPTKHLILHGDDGAPMQVVWHYERGARSGDQVLETRWLGLIGLLEQEYENTRQGKGAKLLPLMQRQRCGSCGGRRLGPAALEVEIEGANIGDISALPAEETQSWLHNLSPGTSQDKAVLGAIRNELAPRLEALIKLGLGHLQLDRASDTLSTGERMRVALAAQIGAPMTGVTFVLDEPTRGLHPQDIEGVLSALRSLVEAGNTVVTIDHEAQVQRGADHLIQLGPGGGPRGGQVIAAGPPKLSAPQDDDKPPHAPTQRSEFPKITLRRLSQHNLRELDLKLPGHGLTVICGPSGSGKSTVLEALRIAAERGQCPGLTRFLHVHTLDAAPLAGGWSSVLASSLGILDPLRALYAKSPNAKAMKLGKSSFSFNSAAGRCPSCKGLGRHSVPLDFLPDAYASCSACGGNRYRPEVLACEVDDLNIAEALALSVEDARKRYAMHPALHEPLERLAELGLGHLPLNRAAQTLSGGEAQRVRLAKHLEDTAGPALFLLDEPSRGLDLQGVRSVRTALRRLTRRGDGVVCISHHPALITHADHVVELGPGGGPRGGRVVFSGPAAELLHADTATGSALSTALD